VHAHLTIAQPAGLSRHHLRNAFGSARRHIRWWRAPIWFLALFTEAKSFADNPILGSPALNRAGLHVWRLRAAHALAGWRRKRLASPVPMELRERFDRDGFVVIENVLPDVEFEQLRKALFEAELECRIHQQGDTITRRVPLGPALQRRFPSLGRMVKDRTWRRLIAYVASTRCRPLYYLQTIAGGVLDGPADPQIDLHSDTFHPSLKAWLFLTDVAEEGRPLTYVAGSHRLSPERLAWERRKSVEVLESGDRLSQRGSFRVRPDELAALGLAAPTRFCVPANTLVIVDTCGFHSRADASGPTVRVELWGFCRRNPFVPWVGGGLWAWPSFADRRAGLVYRLVDRLSAWGLLKQHWVPGGRRRLLDL
jgi:hypothetical protein